MAPPKKIFMETKMKKENLLVEGEEAGAEIIAEGVNNEGKTETDIEVKWQHAGVINRNTRLYPKEILKREIKKINSRINSGETIWGAAYHPPDAWGKPTDVSHKWKKIWMEKDGTCKGILSLVGTRVGEDIKALIQAGKVGISSRGTGTVTNKKGKDGKEYKEVNPDYKMTTPGDFVTAPSVVGAGTLGESFRLYESQLMEAEEDEKKVEDRKMTITNDTVINAYTKARSEGWKGTFVEFKSLHPELLPEEENPVKKSIKESKEEKPKKKRVTAGEVYEQARKAGMSPDEYARILNENLEKEESSGKELRLMREAKIASYDQSALAPFVPKDPKRIDRGPDKKVRLSPLAPRNLHIKEEAEPEEPKHKFKTREEIIETSKKVALDPELQARIKILAKGDAERDEALRRERSLAGPPRKLSLERGIEILAEKVNDLVSRFDKALGENEE